MTLALLIFLTTMGISLFATWRVKENVNRFSRVPTMRGLTGAQVADYILRREGIHDVEIRAADGFLGDHYDPMHKRLVLSSDNFHSTSVAAVGIAAHEAGHAIQHAKAYLPLHLRMTAVGVTNFASSIVTILPLVGLFTGMFALPQFLWILALGWGVIMAFNLVTLPVEFDASNRAKALLNTTGVVTPQESYGVNKVLNAAAWTYVAAFLTSLGYLLFYLLPLLGHSDES